MTIDPKNTPSEDDPVNLGDDATAMFDNSRSNPTERASSENLGAQTDPEEEELDDSDLDDEDDDEEEVDEEDAEEEDDDDLVTNPRAPSAYRML